jgi:hypothetical protein
LQLVTKRGLDAVAPKRVGEPAQEYDGFEIEESVGGLGDLVLLASFSLPTEAHILRGCLEASDISAVVADEHLVQMHSVYSLAVGGVRVMVPESHLAKARETLDAFKRGEYAIDENTDLEGEPHRLL